jgi:hypothetical protein
MERSIAASQGRIVAASTDTACGLSCSSVASARRLDHLSGMVSVAPSSATKIASRLAGSVVLAFALTR